MTNVVVGFLGGLVLGSGTVAVGYQASNDLNPGLGVLVFIVGLSLSVTVHELGHLLAGWAMGFHFSFISVGPLSLRLEHGKSMIRVRREMPALGFAGIHVNGVRRLRHRMLIYIVAGPAANLVSIPIVVMLTNHTFSMLANSWPASLAAEYVLISTILGAVSLVPLGSSSSSDGSRIAMLLGSRERARRWLSIIALGSQQHKGKRVKERRQTWLKAASSLRDNSVDEFSANWMAYVSANGRKDEARAARYLERCLELASLLRPSVRDLVAMEGAVFTSWFRNDAQLAVKWVAQIKKLDLIQRLQRIRLNVALGCARRDFDAALGDWQEGLLFIQKLPASAARETLMEAWQKRQTEIQERESQPTTSR